MSKSTEELVYEIHAMQCVQSEQINNLTEQTADIYNRLHGKDGNDGLVQEVAAIKRTQEECKNNQTNANEDRRSRGALLFAALSCVIALIALFKRGI